MFYAKEVFMVDALLLHYWFPTQKTFDASTQVILCQEAPSTWSGKTLHYTFFTKGSCGIFVATIAFCCEQTFAKHNGTQGVVEKSQQGMKRTRLLATFAVQ